MINSRSIDELIPEVRDMCKLMLETAKESGVDLLVTSTYRDFEYQDDIYAQGRTKPGKIVTKARGGDSYHNYRMAFDVVPIVDKKPIWDNDELWKIAGAAGKLNGLEWGGDWKFKDKPHFQWTNGMDLAELKRIYPQGVLI